MQDFLLNCFIVDCYVTKKDTLRCDDDDDNNDDAADDDIDDDGGEDDDNDEAVKINI